jgi:shikimate dehydrogenase
MHGAALEELGLAGGWSYEAIEVSPADFESVVRSLPDAGFAGVNVTIPHKRTALEIADAASDTARAIGAANTLSFSEGRIEADNTDAPGLIAARPRSPRGERALVLGAGGAARAAVWALADAGAEVSVWNRTRERGKALARELGVSPIDADGPDTTLPAGSFGILVNATSVGLQPPVRPGDDLKGLNLDADAINERQLVVDLVYAESETELVGAARAARAGAVDGREVLVHQGAASLRIWTGREPPLETMRRAIGANPEVREAADDS